LKEDSQADSQAVKRRMGGGNRGVKKEKKEKWGNAKLKMRKK
jgi:hypothetical protein